MLFILMQDVSDQHHCADESMVNKQLLIGAFLCEGKSTYQKERNSIRSNFHPVV